MTIRHWFLVLIGTLTFGCDSGDDARIGDDDSGGASDSGSEPDGAGGSRSDGGSDSDSDSHPDSASDGGSDLDSDLDSGFQPPYPNGDSDSDSEPGPDSDADTGDWSWGEGYVQYAIDNWQTISAAVGGTSNTCAMFQSYVLRNYQATASEYGDINAIVTEGPASQSCDIQLECQLETHGFSPHQVDASLLRTGDICFTQDLVEFQGKLWPSHVFVFSRWVTDGSTDEAYIVDNQGNEHIRNMTVPGSYDQFQYFMRSPKMPWDGLDLNAGWD
jgi:hypothetical protein